ncbi:MAG: hypothetical protein J0L70_18310 [Leptolyngbya sp. UWPOB_LEPTO1]|uniref:hypothetical protein n=1 Tax=Leptolyngbya sp. UWPOB_LEPTO1 TaxID=2815653 RepID=UPI001ACCF601|nr:hypothetical protein [Leptolyngbya sp. UWPOB_LEPTO1]MBN8562489.1 hypothetical protein [Leptolyngbya sp. UWPOB_LEPTO1]
MKQVRASIPSHLQTAFFEVGRQLNTNDPTVICTHILSCYFTGDRSDSPKQLAPREVDAFELEDLGDWATEESC